MHLSFVLLERPHDVDGAAIVASHARLFPAVPRPLSSSSEPQIAELRSPDGLVTHVALMPAPVPNGEADAAARSSLAAFSPSGPALRPHAAHLFVTTHGTTGDLDTLKRHTRVVAACVDAYRAVAVNEGNARATHPAAFYVDAVTGMEEPIMVWTGVSIASDPSGRVSLLTLGAQATMGIPDMIISARRGGANEALAMVFDMLSYVVQHGEPLPDGDTIGRDADEKLLVRYVPSPVGGEHPVASIDLP